MHWCMTTERQKIPMKIVFYDTDRGKKRDVQVILLTKSIDVSSDFFKRRDWATTIAGRSRVL